MLSQQQLQKELNKTTEIIKTLEKYSDRTVNQLPKETIDELNDLIVGPKTTSSGLEKVESILTSLYVSEMRLKEAYENPEKFKKTYSSSLKNSPSNTEKTDKTSSQKPQTIKVSLDNTSKDEKDETKKPSINLDLKSENDSKKENSPIKVKLKPDPDTTSKPPSATPPPSSSIKL